MYTQKGYDKQILEKIMDELENHLTAKLLVWNPTDNLLFFNQALKCHVQFDN